jgi:hypothetical protein
MHTTQNFEIRSTKLETNPKSECPNDKNNNSISLQEPLNLVFVIWI